MKKLYILLVATIASVLGANAQSLNPDSLDENFVIASVLVASPGGQVYSVFGHTALRMQCPTHGLDYVFSYESEEHGMLELKFLAGLTHGRTCSVSTEEYLRQYAGEGRGVRSYTLNLPIAVKQDLWRILDEDAMERERPYDFNTHSCGALVFRWLRQAAASHGMTTDWPAYFDRTNYELCADHDIENPWQRFLLMAVFQGDTQDTDEQPANKVRTPISLIQALSHTTVDGHPILQSADAVALVQQTHVCEVGLFTPLVAAILFVLGAVANLWRRNKWLRTALLVPMLALGTLATYLVFYRPFVGSEWNWLLIPLSPFPFLCWRWRGWWALPMAAVCILWALGMSLSPHRLVDTPMILLGAAMALVCAEIHLSARNNV